MGIIIKRPVRVKVFVTERFKQHRSAELHAGAARLDEVARRLGVQLESPSAPEGVRERLSAELRKTQDARAAIDRELEKVSSLEVGSEFDRGVLEGEVELNVGDDFSKVGVCEILIKDDKVEEIRDGIG